MSRTSLPRLLTNESGVIIKFPRILTNESGVFIKFPRILIVSGVKATQKLEMCQIPLLALQPSGIRRGGGAGALHIIDLKIASEKKDTIF